MNNSGKRILVCGFMPFDGDDINPSSELLNWLNLEKFPFEIKTQLLPVSFTKAYPRLYSAIEEFSPTAVILTGLAKNRTELTIEKVAFNWVDARIADNDGLQLLAQKIIDEDAADELPTTLPIEVLLETSLASGCPTKISKSAGEYVCNHIIYLYLSKHSIPGTFIHLPGSNDYKIFFQGISAIIHSID